MKLFGIEVLSPLTRRQWRSAVLLFVSYLAATRLSSLVFTAPGILFPASGIAIAGLYLEGLALWPVVYFAALLGYVLDGSSLVYVLILPIAHVLQAVLGAWILRSMTIDPLFRRLKDMLAVIGVSLIAGLIVPTFGTIARHLNSYVYDLPLSSVTWGSWYAATVFSLLVITPFIIRWFAKPRFKRSSGEVLETVLVFAVFLTVCYFLFFTTSTSVAGISLVYILLLPLFWIALRLRPRFTTLAFIFLSIIAFSSLFFGPRVLEGVELGTRMFQTELFLIIMAIIFFILTSLEEDRRMTTNLMRSQVSTLQAALDEVASQDRAKSEFIAMLAHELRNPLAPVVSAIDILRSKEVDPKEQREMLDLMENRMHTMRRLLNDLLDVSRITENKLALEKEHIDVATIVTRAVASSEPYFKTRNQELVLCVPEERFVIEADPVRIEQVITNLLTNASKFSNPRDTITLTVQEAGSMVEISVQDAGVGIEKDMLGRIFEPFLQVELGKRTRQGIGIGLALVRSLTEMHGGVVRATSEGKNKGSRFTILLPLVRKTQEPLREEVPKAPELAPKDRGRKILVVDDNDSAAWGIGKLLELKGYLVEYAYDGEQALEKAKSFAPFAIFLDIGLPDMDGYEVGRKLRSAGFPGRLIALTGYSLEEDKKRGHALGFDTYLIKPVGLADLMNALRDT